MSDARYIPDKTTPAPSARQYWLMNFQGWFLDHDLLADRLYGRTISLVTRDRPGISISSLEASLPFAQSLTLDKRHSLPMPLPRLLSEQQSEGLLSFRIHDSSRQFEHLNGNFMTLVPVTRLVETSRKQAKAWETFLAVSDVLALSLGWLLSGQVIEVMGDDQVVLAPARIADPFILHLGNHRIPLGANIKALEQLALMVPGESRFVQFRLIDGTVALHCRRVG